MRTLLHMPLDPGSRMARILLAEKGLPVCLVETPPWREPAELLARNPAGEIPVLIDEPPTGGEVAVAPALVIADYLEEAYGAAPMLPATSAARGEARRIAHWFDRKFESEVNQLILRRRVDERLAGARRLEPEPYRAGAERMRWHLDYLAWLLDRRAWLAGERMTLADVAAAAHLSANDYVSAVPWSEFPTVKEWYLRMKCRPSFRPILADRLEGAPPPSHYDDLDF
ncbi:MAG: glutathione S-transferase family protein [Alphaproteobacteria bacterium]|nr:glutathione S-transferase family protein [Alphaproteobacteria bacterium]